MPKPFPKLGLHAPYVVNVVMGSNGSIASACIPIDDYLKLVEVRESHTAAGNDGGAVTLMIEKLTSTQGPTGGANMLGTATFDLKGTANTVVRKVMSALQPAMTVAQKAATRVVPGDRVSLTIAGTVTTLAGVGVTLVFHRERQQASQTR